LIARVIGAVGEANTSKVKFRNVNGCDQCRKTGFLGRTVIAEMIEPDDQLLQFIRNEDYSAARDHWGKTGGVPLYKNVMAKILSGELDPQFAEDTVGYLSE